MSKEQPQRNDKDTVRQRSPQPDDQNVDMLSRQTHPAPLIQQAKLDPKSLLPRDVLQLQRTVGNRAVGQLLAQTAQRQSLQKQANKPDTPGNLKNVKHQKPLYLGVSAGTVLQLLYLWDRSREAKPRWSEDSTPPSGYLPSGRHNDQIHGEDDLYARMGDADLFYGIAYEKDPLMKQFLKALTKISKENFINIETPEGLTAALVKYEQTIGIPVLDVVVYQAVYAGSSGWDKYTNYIGNGSNSGWAKYIQQANPNLKWANDPASFGCQIAMISAIMRNGSVRFLLDGMQNIQGILEGTAFKGKVTSEELKFIVSILGETIKVDKDKSVKPTDGVNVFFYLNRELIHADQLYLIGQDNVQALALAMAKKVAEEEEWDDDDPDILELQKEFAKQSVATLLELLRLP